MFDKLSLRKKLIFMVMLPVMGLLYFSIIHVMEKYIISSEMDAIDNLSSLAIKISDLIHESQKERGVTGGYLGSFGKKFVSEIDQQKTQTNKKIILLKIRLKDFKPGRYGKEFSDALNMSLRKLKSIYRTRNSITKLNIDASEAIDFYSKMNRSFLNVISHLSQLTTLSEISDLILGYNNFLLEKESAGQERALLNETFTRGKFKKGMFEKFISLLNEQEIYNNFFMKNSNYSAKQYFNKISHDKSFVKVREFENLALLKKTGNVDSLLWFNTMTFKINLLKKVEDMLSLNIKKTSSKFKSKANKEFKLFILIALILIFSAFLLIFLISHQIINQLGGDPTQIYETAENIAKKNLLTTNDVIDRPELSVLHVMKNLEVQVNDRTSRLIETIKQLKNEVNEHIKSKEELSKSKFSLLNAQKIASLGNMHWDTDTGIWFWSDETYRILGLKPGLTDASIDLLFKHISPDNLNRVKDAFGNAKKNHKHFNLETRIISSEGGKRFVRLSGEVSNNIENKSKIINITIQDISKVRELEKQLLQSQKMEAVGQLAGGIAHDFNTILGIITGYGDMMRDSITEGTRLRDNLEEIMDASYRAKDLIKQLLDFSRPEKKVLTQINLTSEVEKSIKFLQTTITSSIIITFKKDGNAGYISGDPGKMQQIILNLGMNAADAIGKNNGNIIFKISEVYKNRDFNHLNNEDKIFFIKLTISDTGSGIKHEYIDRIFEPFFSTKDVGKGTGLGLAMVHGIVKDHNGFITVESVEGKGTSFNLFFPKSD